MPISFSFRSRFIRHVKIYSGLISYRLKTVHTEGDAGAGPEAEEAAGAAEDPGHGARLLLGLGGDRGLAVRAGHLHRSVAETRGLDILDLGDT